MAEEFHAGICEGAWWNSSKPMFKGCSSPCSMGISDFGSFGWGTDMVDIKARSCEESTNNSISDHSSIVFQGHAHQKPQQADSDSGGGSILIDSTLQMMGFGLSSSATSDWNQSLLRSNGRTEGYNSTLQEDINSRLSCRQETGMDFSQIQKVWSQKSYTSPGEDSSITTFKPINQDFSLEQQRLNSVTSSGNSAPTCQGLSSGFPIGSASYGYPSTLLQSLFEPDPQTQQQSLFNNRSINYLSSAAATYGANANEFSPSWPKLTPFIRPPLAKQQPSSLHFSNNTPFWNASATGVNDDKASFLHSPQSQFLVQTFDEKPNCPSMTTKTNNTEEIQNPGSVMKKGISEPPFKRPRIETPSTLPTFKVRKEKLGDRITALQQLVSPFGKTDTASVLHEAIEYIKFLHDQVNVLSTPYMKQAAASIQQQQSTDKLKDPEGPKQDLRSRGLCLVPISSTFPVANETTVDFWTPTFGGSFR
ncbi:transcription factor bHLH112-like [Durio zibethinus]|uniref:Transcription factor bHLH112-like n=1 Tax=Durio zibethinus TaxID=66656 RepID=A0A6P6BJT2_DURZI|nr:transcription factor bHLH112-like [Durio zibethinus]